MKKQFGFMIFTTLIVLSACQPPVVFDKPQPEDVAALGGFPRRIQGKFLSAEDNSVLEINSKTIIRTYDFDLKVHVSQLDSNHQLIGDTLFDLTNNEGSVVRIEGDSVVQHVYEQDTLFAIDFLNVLKKFKGYYFINIFALPDRWQVMKLEVSHGTLALSSINRKEDIDQLKVLTETTQDTTPYVFSPSRKQFRNFVRNQGFRDTEKFTKMRN